MAIITSAELRIGDTIRFTSISTHDNVIWVGKIEAICGYDIARQYADIDTYYQDIARTIKISNKEKLNYLILRTTMNETESVNVVFATEWIEPSSLEKIVENTYTDIRIYDIDPSKVPDVLQALTAMGYTVDEVH